MTTTPVSRLGPIALLAVLVAAGCGVAPNPLPTLATFNGNCRGVGFDGHITGDPSDPRVAWLISAFDGARRDVVWPPGYSARFSPRLVVLDDRGVVAFRDGDAVTGGCVDGSNLGAPLLIYPGA